MSVSEWSSSIITAPHTHTRGRMYFPDGRAVCVGQSAVIGSKMSPWTHRAKVW